MKTESVAGSSNSTPKKLKSKNKVQKADVDKAPLCKELSRMVQDAHMALTDHCSHNAEKAFRQALALLETTTPEVKKISLSSPVCFPFLGAILYYFT